LITNPLLIFHHVWCRSSCWTGRFAPELPSGPYGWPDCNHHRYGLAAFLSTSTNPVGSGQGIGAEAARLFANEGCKVVVCDVDSAKADAVAKAINDASPNRAISVPGDVLDKGYFEVLVRKAAEFGGGKIHYIVNNAGYTWDGVIHKMSDKQWDTILAVHTTAPFRLVRTAAPYFRVKDGENRCIVNISSTSGTHGNAGQANYSLAKAGVTGLTKTIAKEWGPQFVSTAMSSGCNG